jgi:predicted nucleotidyltransferase
MKSKEDNILELFFNNPTKQWHFEDMLKEGKITRSKASLWLRRLSKQGLIKRIKARGKMPYFIANYSSPDYQNKKRIFALSQLYESGFLNHLVSLGKAKTIILFGSFSRWDWYQKSDIDIFIYGNPEGLDIGKYEIKLHRDIQLFICENMNELKKLGKGLIKSIIKGDIIKGDIGFVKVGMNA